MLIHILILNGGLLLFCKKYLLTTTGCIQWRVNKWKAIVYILPQIGTCQSLIPPGELFLNKSLFRFNI